MELQQQVAEILVSVPIRGLFNLTFQWSGFQANFTCQVSVPIRGLFNLTGPQTM